MWSVFSEKAVGVWCQSWCNRHWWIDRPSSGCVCCPRKITTITVFFIDVSNMCSLFTIRIMHNVKLSKMWTVNLLTGYFWIRQKLRRLLTSYTIQFCAYCAQFCSPLKEVVCITHVHRGVKFKLRHWLRFIYQCHRAHIKLQLLQRTNWRSRPQYQITAYQFQWHRW